MCTTRSHPGALKGPEARNVNAAPRLLARPHDHADGPDPPAVESGPAGPRWLQLAVGPGRAFKLGAGRCFSWGCSPPRHRWLHRGMQWGGCASEHSRRPSRACGLADSSYNLKDRTSAASFGRVRVRSTLPVLAGHGSRLLKGRPPLADVRSGNPPVPVAGRGGCCLSNP